ncbi:MAG: serine hydrolase domain-containing protein [Bacteroidota bacterium]
MTLKKGIKIGTITLLTIIIGAIWFLLYETIDELEADHSSIDQYLQKFYNPNRTAGFAVAVFSADTIYFKKGYGYADVALKRPYTTNTQQYIASVSKTLIGISLLKAQELDILDLNTPINEYLPFEVSNPSYPDSEITLRHLATHTSSLDYNETVVESLYIADTLKNPSLSPIMGAYFMNRKMGDVTYGDYRPGTKFNYSNIGASLAAYVIEIQSGMTFDQFTQKFIFERVGMNNSTWFESKAESSLFSTYYESIEKNQLKEVATTGVQMYPSRDLITNIDDLITYCQAILRKDSRLLSQESYALLTAEMLGNGVENKMVDNSGIFLLIDRNQSGVTYSLTGMNGGDNCINTKMWFDQTTGLGYIFIGNTGYSQFNRINHIWLFKSLISLGDHIAFRGDNGTFKNRWHNWYSRVMAIF